jgi:hypothetical protein
MGPFHNQLQQLSPPSHSLGFATRLMAWAIIDSVPSLSTAARGNNFKAQVPFSGEVGGGAPQPLQTDTNQGHHASKHTAGVAIKVTRTAAPHSAVTRVKNQSLRPQACTQNVQQQTRHGPPTQSQAQNTVPHVHANTHSMIPQAHTYTCTQPTNEAHGGLRSGRAPRASSERPPAKHRAAQGLPPCAHSARTEPRLG